MNNKELWRNDKHYVDQNGVGNIPDGVTEIDQSKTPLTDMDLDEALAACKESYDTQVTDEARDLDLDNEIE